MTYRAGAATMCGQGNSARDIDLLNPDEALQTVSSVRVLLGNSAMVSLGVGTN
jgi:hypothetical protein